MGQPVHDLPDAGEDLLRRTNPLTYLGPGLPPFLIQRGSDDDLVPVEQSIARSLHGGPAFETKENMARVFAFLSGSLLSP
jgi:hypothetical protein